MQRLFTTRHFWLTALCSWLLLLPRLEAATVFHYLSESGSSVQGGQERTLSTDTGASFQVSGGVRSIYFDIQKSAYNAPSQYYSVRFTAPPAASALTVGDYPNAVDTQQPGTDNPGLSFFNNGGNSTASGQFKILEITFNPDGSLATFAVNFSTHEFANSPTVFGEIRYNSSVPYLTLAGAAQLSTNRYTVFETDGQLTISVTRREGATGPLTVDYMTVDGTAQAGQEYVAVSGTFSWADGDTTNRTFTVPLLHPADPLRGDRQFFLKLSGPNAGVQSQASATIITDTSAVTFLHFQSDPGDFVGKGQERTLSIANKFVLTASHDYGGGVSFTATDQAYTRVQEAEDFMVSFAAARGAVFGVGDYQHATGYSFDGTAPQLSFSGDGAAPTPKDSNFQVLEAVFDDDGNLSKFAANFEQHVEYGPTVVYGQIRYRSTVPLPPERPPQVVVSATNRTTDDYSPNSAPAVFTITRGGGSTAARLKVSYTVSGSAVNGEDYQQLSGSKTIKAGQTSVQVKVYARYTGIRGKKILNLTAKPQNGQYSVQNTKAAKVKIYHFVPPTP